MVRRLILCLALPLAAQDFEGLQVSKVAGGFRYADGAAASRAGEYVLFADTPMNRIHRLVPGKAADVLREDLAGPSGLALDERGRVYVCEGRGRRVLRMDSKGSIEPLAESFEGRPLNGPNDLALRRDGHLWFTDPAFGSQLDSKQQPAFAVYHLTPKNEISAVWRGSTRPNGIALSPNGRLLYVTDSDARLVRMWDLDRAGAASDERVLVSGIAGVPGGLRADEKGNLYIAADGILVYSPAGKLLRRIAVPEMPSNCVFGDPDFLSLYITARTGLYRVRMPVRGAQP